MAEASSRRGLVSRILSAEPAHSCTGGSTRHRSPKKEPAARGHAAGRRKSSSQIDLASIRCICFKFVGELMPSDDSDLMRRSRHSIERERRGLRFFLDYARSHDRHLQRTDGETRYFILRQLSGGGRRCSQRERRECCNRDSLKRGHRYLLLVLACPTFSDSILPSGFAARVLGGGE